MSDRSSPPPNWDRFEESLRLEELRAAVRDLMACWPELDNIPEETLGEHRIIVSARQMLVLKELIGE